LHEGKFEKRALKKVEELIPVLKEDSNNRDNYALYYFLKGSILKGLGKTERAEEMLKRALQNPQQLTDGLYAVPYSLCELAEIEIEKSEFLPAEQHLAKAKAFKSYDWERLVNVKISTLGQKVAEKRKKLLK